ncbi:putative membrane protein [Alteribacillus persepolensis]|uniref:Putative membrane protein n=1 Tax=Alteribacillus persepolensis TaxID=568899 RepID=A0A1G8BMK0_9BACI|nr:DUF350 domain-containing protein [Alteribacillus persepolensis]SDH34452.1 putative membrane protein [Alteribacillus persepolensis]
MEVIMQNTFAETAANFSVAVLSLIVFLAIFETITPYKNWEEIKNGNIAVALATGGKLLGVSNILRFSIEHNDAILTVILWGAYGFFLLVLSYVMFEFLTPMFKVDEELAADNRAVGFISFIISIGLSYVIGAGILA